MSSADESTTVQGHDLEPASRFRLLWERGSVPDVASFLRGLPGLTPTQVLAIVRTDQDRRWRAGQPVPAEDYLGQHPVLAALSGAAVELICAEFVLRRERGEAPTPEEYTGRFPALAVAIRDQLASRPVSPEDVSAFRTLGGEGGEGRPGATGRSSAGDVPAIPGYAILEEIGRGGMGVVYKARQTGLNRLVALKMILAGGYAEAGALRRFQVEAESVARLQHPNIVQVYEIGAVEGRPFFSLEYVAGGTLAQYLGGRPHPADQAAALIETLARAVHAAHERGIIHRDLKPANILLASRESRAQSPEPVGPWRLSTLDFSLWTPKIADFGLAKDLAAVDQTGTGAIVGTPRYMAPEQAGGRTRQLGPWTDVYALGAILYEMLVGRPPFQDDSALETLRLVLDAEPVPPSRLLPRLPRDLETICLRCLEKEQRRRYATALDLAEDLRRFRADEPVRARPVGAVERGWKWARRRPAVAGMMTGMVALTVLGFTLVSWKWLDAVAARDQAQAAQREAEQEARRAREAEHAAEAAHQGEQAQRERAVGLSKDLAVQMLTTTGYTVSADDVLKADENLDAFPPEPRGWDWHYLKRRCHAEQSTLPIDGGTLAGAVSPDGQLLATGGGDLLRPNDPAALQVWDLRTGQRRWITQEKHSGPILQVRLHPDGRHVASASINVDLQAVVRGGASGLRASKGEVILWDARSGKRVRTFLGGGSVSFHPGGKLLATAGADETVLVYDVDTGAEVATLPGHAGRVGAVRFSPDGKLLAVASWKVVVAEGQSPSSRRSIHLWDTATWKAAPVPAPLAGDDGGLGEFSPDGKRLATLHDRQAKVWDVASGSLVRTLAGHRQDLTDVHFSADGRRLATASMDGSLRLWDLATGAEQQRFAGHGPVYWTRFAPPGADGIERLLSGGEDGSVRVWDPRSGQYPLLLHGHRAHVTGVAFGREGRLLTSAPEEGTAIVWDARTGRPLLRLPCHAYAAAFSPDGKWIAAGGGTASPGSPGELTLWNADTGRPLPGLPGRPARFVTALAFSPDGKRLVTAAGDFRRGEAGEVTLWELAGRKAVASRPFPGACVQSVAFRPDGQALALAGSDGVVRLCEPTALVELHTLRGPGEAVKSVAFSPDGRSVAAGMADGIVIVWDSVTRAERWRRRARGSIAGLAFSPDGTCLAGATASLLTPERQVLLWDADRGQEKLILPGGYTVAFSPDGSRLAAAHADATAHRGDVVVWDAIPAEEALTLRGHGGIVFGLAYRPDGRQLAAGHADGGIHVWNPATGQETRVLKGHDGPVAAVAFSPNGDRLASVGVDSLVRVWDTASGRAVAVLEGHRRPGTQLWGVAFHPDGRRLASCGHDGTIQFWDLAADPRLVRTLVGETQKIWGIVFSPDGRLLASGDNDGRVQLWDAETGRLLGGVGRHAAAVRAVAFSPDGRLLATASVDRTARLWDLAAGTEVRTLAGHLNFVRNLAFSPDGRLLATASFDRTVRLWDAHTGRAVHTFRGHANRVQSVAFRPDGQALASSSYDQTVRIWILPAGAQPNAR
jgi:WD40 repeat protein